MKKSQSPDDVRAEAAEVFPRLSNERLATVEQVKAHVVEMLAKLTREDRCKVILDLLAKEFDA